MRAHVHVLIVFIIICVVLCYNLNKMMLRNINHKIVEFLIQKIRFNINDKVNGDLLLDPSLNGKNGNKKCFHLTWNRSSNTKIVGNADTHTNRYNYSVLTDAMKYCDRFITIGKYAGRMGNQMFQVAAVIGAAYLYDMIPVIPEGNLKKYIDIPNRYNIQHLQKSVNCSCKKTGIFYSCEKLLNSSFNVTMQGAFQSWRYFDAAKYIIKRVFRLKRVHIKNAKQFLRNATTKGFVHICIHVRRGDMLKKAYKHNNISYDKFIRKAMNFYLSKFKKVDFILVSEDKFWCKEHIKNVPISPFRHAGDDMALMILSDHVIITAGTYGWWGAWLSGGTTVYFKGFLEEKLSRKFVTADYYPPNWIGL